MKKRSGFSVMMRLIGLVRTLAGIMVLAILMGLIGNLCAAFISVFGGMAVLRLIGFSDLLSLKWIFLSMILFALLRGILRYAEQSCNHYIAFKLLALIRSKVFEALRRLCPAKLEGRDRGNLIAVITSDIELLEVFYAHTVSPVCIAVLFCMILCGYIGRFHWILGSIAFAAYLTVGCLVPLVISRVSGCFGQRYRSKSGELSGFVLESLRGLDEILQYGCGEARLKQMISETEKLLQTEEKMKKNAGENMAVTNSLILLFDLAMLFAAGMLYLRGMVTFPGLVLSVLALMSSFGPAVALANLGSTLQNTFAAGNRVLDILEESPVVEEISDGKEVDFGGLKTENLSFSYGEEKILDQISMDFPENSIIGIVGKSGSGKSTLLRLMMRFWKPQGGKVSISDTDLEEINTGCLRNMESFVTQQTHLFHDSIRNNLRIAKLDASDSEIVEACKKASVHDFIMTLPEGYATRVGELGDTLSGGERQRIGIARAFLHNAPLLLLDEPTSNLDSLNEAVILRSVQAERGKKTVILVSHRVSTMRITDRVYSADQGRVS